MTEAPPEPLTTDISEAGSGGEEENAATAREDLHRSISDESRRHASRVVKGALDEALSSFDGSIHAHTLIVGDPNVGTLVGRDYHSVPSQLPFVPSGPVSRSMLEHLEKTFVAPPGFASMCRELRSSSLLLLRAPAGWGRTATAIRALVEEGAVQVHKLNPDVELRALNMEFAQSTGYLLDGLETEQARTLRPFHLEHLGRKLADHRSLLIVVVDSVLEVPVDVEPYLHEGGDPADTTEVVCSHLRGHGVADPVGLLARTDVVALLNHMRSDRRPTRELAQLARQLADVAAGRAAVEVVLEQHSAAVDQQFCRWFDIDLDTEARAFAIALAVFNRMPLHIVFSAASALFHLIGQAEDPEGKGPGSSVFGTRRAELLETIRAESYRSSESTEYGRIPTDAVRFRHDHYPRRVLEYVWREHHVAHQIVRSWLRGLGADADLRVCSRAGVGVGLLSTFEFEHVRKLIIEPWADSDDNGVRLAAVGALQIPALQAELAPLVARMLVSWSRRGRPLGRRVTAIAALGTTVGQAMPDIAFRVLRRTAAEGRPELQDAICHSMYQLFEAADLTARVLRQLRRWTESGRSGLRDTGLRCVLVLCFEMEVDAPRGARSWPGMVWLADEYPEYRADVVTLVARLMEAPFYLPLAYREIKRWVRVGEKDPSFLPPLARLLRALGSAIDDTDIIPYHLSDWAAEPGGPVRAVEYLLTVLDPKDDPT